MGRIVQYHEVVTQMAYNLSHLGINMRVNIHSEKFILTMNSIIQQRNIL